MCTLLKSAFVLSIVIISSTKEHQIEHGRCGGTARLQAPLPVAKLPATQCLEPRTVTKRSLVGLLVEDPLLRTSVAPLVKQGQDGSLSPAPCKQQARGLCAKGLHALGTRRALIMEAAPNQELNTGAYTPAKDNNHNTKRPLTPKSLQPATNTQNSDTLVAAFRRWALYLDTPPHTPSGQAALRKRLKAGCMHVLLLARE